MLESRSVHPSVHRSDPPERDPQSAAILHRPLRHNRERRIASEQLVQREFSRLSSNRQRYGQSSVEPADITTGRICSRPSRDRTHIFKLRAYRFTSRSFLRPSAPFREPETAKVFGRSRLRACTMCPPGSGTGHCTYTFVRPVSGLFSAMRPITETA